LALSKQGDVVKMHNLVDLLETKADKPEVVIYEIDNPRINIVYSVLTFFQKKNFDELVLYAMRTLELESIFELELASNAKVIVCWDETDRDVFSEKDIKRHLFVHIQDIYFAFVPPTLNTKNYIVWNDGDGDDKGKLEYEDKFKSSHHNSHLHVFRDLNISRIILKKELEKHLNAAA
jgi:hypothetical protein